MSDVIITARGNNRSSGSIPSSVILLWYGSVDSIPEGWQLCNGTNGTPDLRDRFIVGAGNSYSVGNTGGADTVTLSVDQIPSHTHNVEMIESSTYNRGSGPLYEENKYGYRTIGIKSNSTGGGAAHENRPPYYALCYIMKL